MLGGGCEQVIQRPVVSLGGGYYRRMRQFEFPGLPELGVAQDPRKRSLTGWMWLGQLAFCANWPGILLNVPETNKRVGGSLALTRCWGWG